MRVVILAFDSFYNDIVMSCLPRLEAVEVIGVVLSDCLIYRKSTLSSIRKIIKTCGLRYFLFKSLEGVIYQHLIRNLNILTDKFTFMRYLTASKIPILKTKDINNLEGVNFIKELSPDLIICHFNQLLGKEVLSIPSLGSINLHPGFLPDYKGLAPYFWCMVNAETTGGGTIHHMDETFDTGAVIGRDTYQITDTETIHSSYYKACLVLASLLPKVINQFVSGQVETPAINNQGGNYYSWPPKEQLVKYYRQRGKFLRFPDCENYFKLPKNTDKD